MKLCENYRAAYRRHCWGLSSNCVLSSLHAAKYKERDKSSQRREWKCADLYFSTCRLMNSAHQCGASVWMTQRVCSCCMLAGRRGVNCHLKTNVEQTAKLCHFAPCQQQESCCGMKRKKDAEHQVAFCRLEKCYNASPFTTEPWTCYGRHLREVSLISAVSPSVGLSLVHKAVSSQSHQSFLSVRLKFAIEVKCLWGCARVNSNCNCSVLFGLGNGHRVTLLVFIWNNSKNILEFYNVFSKQGSFDTFLYFVLKELEFTEQLFPFLDADLTLTKQPPHQK